MGGTGCVNCDWCGPLQGDFNAKVGSEEIFKPTIGNESLHETSNDNGVRVVNFATPKNHTVRCSMFPHCSVYKSSWILPGEKTHSHTDYIFKGDGIQMYLCSIVHGS
jgi:hypothetical protein